LTKFGVAAAFGSPKPPAWITIRELLTRRITRGPVMRRVACRPVVRFRLWSLLAALLVAVCAPGAAGAQTRVALVIGNGAYQAVPGLANPVNDASDVAASLRRLDFNVKLISNARYDDMRRALVEFGQQARVAEFAVIFFAGHGIEMGGENWLIPVDAQLATDVDVPGEAIGLQFLTRIVSNSTRLGLVILDACRTNPFLPRMQRTNMTRSTERGFARVEPSDNVLVAFAARDGTTANDGQGRNSPFTQALLKNLETPGLEVRFLFANVRDEVMAATNRAQQPFTYGSLSAELMYFKPPPAAGTAPGPVIATLNAPSSVGIKPSISPPRVPPQDNVDPSSLPAMKVRLTSTFPKSLAAGESSFVKKVADLSAGRMEIASFAAGEIVPGLQALDAASNSTVEMAWSPGQYYVGKDPALHFLSFIPFGFDPITHINWRNQADVRAVTDKMLRDRNVVAIPCTVFGPAFDFFARKPVDTVAALQGLKIRIGGIVGQFMQKTGVVPQQIAGGDIYPALQAGTIDAASWLDPGRTEPLGFQKVTKVFYYPASLDRGQVIDLFVSLPFWEGLPPAGRQILQTACSENVKEQNAGNLEDNESALGRIQASGVKVAPLATPVRLALLKSWEELASEISAKNSNYKLLYESANRRRNEMFAGSLR
jgi:TRAP-type mannitol/chloroaromatic compound transport system substrate-binding protein